MENEVSLEQAHKMCDHLEKDIASKLPNTSIIIHCEP
jgi:divalent metal cation (Fe/Co/Zn/Cd) transporter